MEDGVGEIGSTPGKTRGSLNRKGSGARLRKERELFPGSKKKKKEMDLVFYIQGVTITELNLCLTGWNWHGGGKKKGHLTQG